MVETTVPPETPALEYLRSILGVEATAEPWQDAARLPAFLTARYLFALAEVGGRAILLMIDRGDEGESPAVVRKHLASVQTKWSGLIAYVREHVNAYARRRLIEQRVPFVVPGNQMYLPELGLDLREHFKPVPREVRVFRPATQAVLLELLISGHREATAAELRGRLAYSPITLSRAFDDLETAGLAESATLARERVLRLRFAGRELWRAALPMLSNPVRSRYYPTRLVAIEGALHAGEDALARYTALAPPRVPVVAVTGEMWSGAVGDHPGLVVQDRADAAMVVEVWRYPPREGGTPRTADPLSVYLSLREATDERVEQALTEMVESVAW